MGLFDSVLGAAMGGNQPAGGGVEQMLGSLLGGNQGAAGGVNGDLIQAAMGLLSKEGVQGGLGGLLAQFQQAGLGEAINSWIGTGENQAVSGDQIASVLGQGTLGDIAAKLGINPSDAAGQLSQILPGLIDKLTPQGTLPEGGFGNAGDLMGMLGGLLQK